MNRLLLSPLVLVAITACSRDDAESRAESRTASRPSSSAALTAREELDGLDGRTSVPLLPMMANHQKKEMRDHLQAVQEIILAMSTDDFDAAERASKRMGFSDEMGAMCTHMGAGAPGFTEQALAFHHTADTIAEGARGHDKTAVLTALGKTLQSCTTCHAAFRQSVVDEATMSRLTGASAPR